MVDDPKTLMKEVRRKERQIMRSAASFLVKSLFRREVRDTAHYKEWLDMPMNYARVMEIPITELMLDPGEGERILDLSSPKILSLRLMEQDDLSLIVSDLEDYFLSDFETYSDLFPADPELTTIDASSRIPYSDNYLDKVFSVSVLEHIPDEGDRTAVEEMVRVVRPGGKIVLTLPVFKEYCEEWTKSSAYWRSVSDEEGRSFFQRRYDKSAFDQLVEHDEVDVDYVLIAEKPLREPEISDEGLMIHNSYLISEVGLARFFRKLRRRKIPLTGWAAERVVSGRCHYLTKDWSDPNIRQVAAQLSIGGH
ncbi:class I SAM-dependent methyltransferase [Alteraurantiacibacter aquimixticola]|uniref:Class I SAM-dependent methyltransferase n=1 Tax=Alteraurantiacibacter aquimixticola TaxID=2489173 RepID=A0A4T3EZL8_9SPHN|nr:methyltransferase domain-containing protein [Alteraurantiacibacter aquimixticola]TIX50231.1 class I SAM-dependent methyltransferase [Alteraurantiacibacter aquimixticola]